ncbi:hypothetical protein TNCV_3976501 [Trichonephila clavipes]|nr:hypothetical protein TNCV_3976501 [Trichonephila clavipes]
MLQSNKRAIRDGPRSSVMTPELPPHPLITSTPHANQRTLNPDRFNVHESPVQGKFFLLGVMEPDLYQDNDMIGIYFIRSAINNSYPVTSELLAIDLWKMMRYVSGDFWNLPPIYETLWSKPNEGMVPENRAADIPRLCFSCFSEVKNSIIVDTFDYYYFLTTFSNIIETFSVNCVFKVR